MHENATYDIAIAGGGLAGLCMAIQAADAGYKAVLFEKEKYPFHKVCGEYISMESYPFLQSLGLPLDSFKLPLISKLTVTSVSGKPYHFNLPLGGFGISRYMLDYELYKLAIAKGVTIVHGKVEDISFDGQLFMFKSNSHSCYAKVGVGSFGKRTNLDVKWKRSFTQNKKSGTNYVGIKYHIRYPHAADEIALHNFADGYCGMSLVEEDKSCLCYLTTASQLQTAGSISKLEKHVLSRNPVLRQIFAEAEFLYDEPLAISQVSFARKSAVYNHVLLAGDAAGLITPLCGNGMSMAMHASKICFAVADRFLQGHISRKEMEYIYQKEWRKEFGLRLKTGRIIQGMFGSPSTTGIFLKMMHVLPPVARRLIAATHGKPF